MADFPATKKTFTQAVDGTTFLEAILFNTGYNEVEALETFIGALGAGNSQSYSTSLNDLLGQYRRGCKVEYKSADELYVRTGAIAFEGDSGKFRLRRNISDLTVGWGNLDTGSETNNTYYVYAVADSAATTFTVLISLSGTAPAGATYYKRLGSFANVGGNIDAASIKNDNEFSLGAGSITQTELKTSIGEVSASSYSINHVALPGGEYGFFPRTKASSTATGRHAVSILGTVGIDGVSIDTSYVTRCMIRAEGVTIYAQQRYVTSSGKDYWLFLLVDKTTKDVLAAWGAADHPSYGNGGDPSTLPHPFLSYDPAVHDVLLIEKDNTEQLLQEAGARGMSLLTFIDEDYTIDLLSSAQYTPLHSGRFLGFEPELIQSIPVYIQVKKLRLMTLAEKTAKQDKLAQERLAREQEKAKRESDKVSARAKLKDLGLTDDELKAVGVA